MAIIDLSFNLGAQKLLVVLRAPIDALAKRGSALTLADTECIGIKISDDWKAKNVEIALHEIFTKVGTPALVIKDSARELEKGIRLLQGNVEHANIQCLADIGHFTANLLKAEYGSDKRFSGFVRVIFQIKQVLKQSELSRIMPPKLRTQGRFMGVFEFAKGVEKLFQLLMALPVGENPSQNDRLEKLFQKLNKFLPFAKDFIKTCNVLSLFLKKLKNEGLNKSSYKRARKTLQRLPKKTKIVQMLSDWLDRHIQIRKNLKLGKIPIPVSSDIIETLFGKFKAVMRRGSNSIFNRLVLIIPALCGVLNETTVRQCLNSTSSQSVQNWMFGNVSPSLWQIVNGCRLRK